MKLMRSFFMYRLFIVSFLLLAFSSVHANQLKGVRAWPSPDNSRVVLDFSDKPDYEIQYLKKPDRLVVDIKSTTSVVDLKSISYQGPLLKNIRESASNSKNIYRLVVDLKKQSKAKIFTLDPAKPYGHRLVIDLPHAVAKDTSKVENINQPVSAGRDVIIAIDAGHGGDDPGALGKYSYEKKITLQIAKRLQKRIKQQAGMDAFLIRNGDYYVNLDKRSELAVKGKADFLVSIHADGFTSSQPSGASVWILSDRRANSEMGRRMERHEVHSELLGGKGEATKSASSVPFLNKVFFDMSKSNSMQVGSDVGDLVLKELKQITKLHKKIPVGASLAVLKSPYIPSILVEAGFITNHREERLLNQAEYQTKVANAVYKGIFKHFIESPPHDSLFAQKKRAINHTVRSGESLSILAERYSVSASQLKSHNKLKSSSLRIGQVLKIPPNYELVVKHDAVKPLSTVTAQPKVHIVKSGESLSLIASRYGKTTTELKSYNKLRSTSLAVGQKINIPTAGGQLTVTTPSIKKVVKPIVKSSVHTVRSGESLSKIASHYGKTTNELKNYNKLRTTTLAIGQKIKIPGSGVQLVGPNVTKTDKPIIHKVRSGESLSVIAKRYGKTSSDLKTYNKLRSTSLAIGQKIKIPSGSVQQVSASTVINEPIVHKVRTGETLSMIANRYGNTSKELKRYNKLRSTSLKVGQKIKIPNRNVQIAPESGQKVSAQETVHKVRSGESLSLIAKRYGKSTNELKTYNKLRSTSIVVGQKIKIPSSGSVIASNSIAKESVHKVRSGESLSLIANRYGKSINDLKNYNNLRSTSLVVGQKIKIPSSDAKIVPKPIIKVTVHKVRSGESLSVIAARYGSTSSRLKQYNKLKSSTLLVGQKIKIPNDVNNRTTHKVRSGESLSVIAKRYGISASLIKSVNNLRSNSLAIGQVLSIPTT